MSSTAWCCAVDNVSVVNGADIANELLIPRTPGTTCSLDTVRVIDTSVRVFLSYVVEWHDAAIRTRDLDVWDLHSNHFGQWIHYFLLHWHEAGSKQMICSVGRQTVSLTLTNSPERWSIQESWLNCHGCENSNHEIGATLRWNWIDVDFGLTMKLGVEIGLTMKLGWLWNWADHEFGLTRKLGWPWNWVDHEIGLTRKLGWLWNWVDHEIGLTRKLGWLGNWGWNWADYDHEIGVRKWNWKYLWNTLFLFEYLWDSCLYEYFFIAFWHKEVFQTIGGGVLVRWNWVDYGIGGGVPVV